MLPERKSYLLRIVHGTPLFCFSDTLIKYSAVPSGLITANAEPGYLKSDVRSLSRRRIGVSLFSPYMNIFFPFCESEIFSIRKSLNDSRERIVLSVMLNLSR